MAPRSTQPRRAVDCADTYLTPTAHARRTVRSGRVTRLSIALGSAGAVGALAFAAPGIALSASPASVPLVATTTDVRVGTTDAFASRTTSTTRDSDRTDTTADVSSAASERAAGLAEQDVQLTESQTTAVAQARTEELTSTGSQIDDEAKRLEAAKFFWPTEGEITSGWGMRMHPILHYTRLHAGVDIGGKLGAPIYATQDGVVTKAATGYNGGSGNNVRINHGTMDGDKIETAYLHMESYVVKVGQEVKKGELIGYVGSTGLSTSAHLHFALYVNGENSDPEPYLNA